MRRISKLLCLGGPALLVCGCVATSGYPPRSNNLAADLASVSGYFSAATLASYDTQKEEVDRRRLRDEIVNGRLLAIDLNFNQFERSLNQQANVASVGADWAVVALGGAGATITGAATKSALAAISGAVAGGKAAVDKDLFYSKTMPVLLTQMEARRKTELVKIRQGLMLDTLKYPLQQALGDLESYYNAGTIPGALAGINTASGSEGDRASVALANLTGKFTTSANGDLLLRFWQNADGTFNLDHQKSLQAWIAENVPDRPSIPTFIDYKQYDAERARAVEFFHLKPNN